jgi:hypothetical protein
MIKFKLKKAFSLSKNREHTQAPSLTKKNQKDFLERLKARESF